MSYAATEWARPLLIKGWSKAVLMCLADHYNEKSGRCDPSISTICREIGCEEKTARKALANLAALGALSRTRRPARADLFALNMGWEVPETAPLPKTVLPKTAPSPSQKRHHPPPVSGTTPLPKTVPEPERTRIKPEENQKGFSDGQANGDRSAAMELDLGGDGTDRCSCTSAKDAWNETAKRCDWPTVQRFAGARVKATEARLGEIGGIEGWQTMLGKMEASPFFRKRWQPSFDWVLKPANLTKVMEGNYDGKSTNEPERGLGAALAALSEPIVGRT